MCLYSYTYNYDFVESLQSNMRKTLVQKLIELDDENTYFLTADVGFGVLEPLRDKMGDRFINVGLAEQSMIGIAAGLALSGKKVYTYTMCAFYLRALEQIRNDICYQDLPVTMIGVGTGYDYEYLGTTHFALEDEEIIGSLRNIEIGTPNNTEQLKDILSELPERPRYLRLTKSDKTGQPDSPTSWIIKNDKYPHFGASKDYFLALENAD